MQLVITLAFFYISLVLPVHTFPVNSYNDPTFNKNTTLNSSTQEIYEVQLDTVDQKNFDLSYRVTSGQMDQPSYRLDKSFKSLDHFKSRSTRVQRAFYKAQKDKTVLFFTESQSFLIPDSETEDQFWEVKYNQHLAYYDDSGLIPIGGCVANVGNQTGLSFLLGYTNTITVGAHFDTSLTATIGWFTLNLGTTTSVGNTFGASGSHSCTVRPSDKAGRMVLDIGMLVYDSAVKRKVVFTSFNGLSYDKDFSPMETIRAFTPKVNRISCKVYDSFFCDKT